MAGFDQPAQVFVGLGVLLVVMPARDVERADARFAPAVGKIIQVDSRAVSAIEESPQTLALKRGLGPASTLRVSAPSAAQRQRLRQRAR